MRKLAILTKVLLVLAMGLAVAAPAGANGVPLKVCKELICDSEVQGVGDGDRTLELFEKWCFAFRITVKNNTLSVIEDVVVTDNFGGELELIKVKVVGWPDWRSVDMPEPWSDVKKPEADIGDGVTVLWTGKSRKVHLTWRVGNLAECDSKTMIVVVCTDINPGGKQEYTSPGCHCLNSGATAKGILNGHQVSDESDSICRYVYEPD